ncbi:hypothetical protein [Rathayibacter toxicus]|uniref:hypothetical protein n=1 Tax=Rathayibacter toxicus TaxID=145458 RepID=UPI001C04B243|nr:hypothetical protein [Rathayibacter toxicus]QWL30885.1 hypothetical protein E2R34_09135 [Rathayibacter toxicus]QWL32983.1 hypothetical protein E2R35_09220 [Rathayibacter toxicus]QWL35077.1 hypothetical protein E2R36_09220 [Rathayibacter toxicus]QWL37208.1 hypothetical protein E2R37_09215 [Rathayibacter toxicus]QWL39300.1 hypothetical protein E2R38_09210 [Rathayibacter toxicus]
MTSRSRSWILALVAASVSLIIATPAQAAQPPAGYPTSQVMAIVSNPAYGEIPIRRGFYDADSNRGFGMDKAWHKHNITSLNAQQIIMASPNGSEQGNGNIDLHTYVGYYRCPENQGSCTLQTQILVHGIDAPNTANYISGWPVDGTVGLLTAYCDNDDRAKDCPNWVTYSLDHPGAENPYAPNALGTQATGQEHTPAPTSPDSAPLRRTKGVRADKFAYSYQPLAPTISK